MQNMSFLDANTSYIYPYLQLHVCHMSSVFGIRSGPKFISPSTHHKTLTNKRNLQEAAGIGGSSTWLHPDSGEKDHQQPERGV